MKVTAITDTHFGHDMLVRNGYRSPGYEMQLLHSLRRGGEVLIHTGDFCIGNDAVWHERFMTHADGFKKRILVRGNHDNKSYSWYYDHGWDAVVEFMQMRIDGKEVLFSHMPLLQEDVSPTLYHKPVVNFHGHMHGRGKYSHRFVEGSVGVFNYDIAPDTHGMGAVSINSLLAGMYLVEEEPSIG